MARGKLGCLLSAATLLALLFAFRPLAPAASYFLAWTLRVVFPTDRVIVLNGHGFRVPAEYPGFNYGGATGGLATAVLWPSMEPWRAEATKGVRAGVCAQLELHLSAHDADKPLQLEAQFAQEARNAKLERKNVGQKLGLTRWDEVDFRGGVWHEIYENRENGSVDFIARCSPLGQSPSQTCTVFQEYIGNVVLTMEVVRIECLKDWRLLRDRTNGLLAHFEDLHAKHK